MIMNVTFNGNRSTVITLIYIVITLSQLKVRFNAQR
jgi:hypothetical protein